MAKHPPDDPTSIGISRRAFMTSAGATMVATTTVGRAQNDQPVVRPADQALPVDLRINGRRHRVLVEPRTTLLEVLRTHLGFTGSKEGCGRGECGACTVLLDDTPRYACMTLAVEAEGIDITTIEGLMRGEELGRVQQAFADADGFQCGFCTPGQIVSVEGLLRRTSAPTTDEIRHAVSGNLCRCGAYRNIVRAAHLAADRGE